MSEYILEVKGITKYFPGVRALNNVHFNLKSAEIHALVGENGAGKSTFIKILTGVLQPDSGEIILNGEHIIISNPLIAKEHGIAAIYQQATSYPDLTVTENIFMNHEIINPKTKKLLWKEMRQKAKELLESFGSDIDPNARMGDLSVAQQQLVEIAKALSVNAKILIMDEPTAALTIRESEELFKITKDLRKKGTSVIFISHRFEDIYNIADRVTVFRDGEYINTWGISEITNDELIKAMVGREVKQLFPKKEVQIGEEIFRVDGLTKEGLFKNISFSLHRGEILGFFGLVGAGRSELFQTIFGIMQPDKGKIFLENKQLEIKDPKNAIDLGIGYLPEDRQTQGLILQFSIAQNISLPKLPDYTHHGFIDTDLEEKTAKKYLDLLRIKATSIHDRAESLSGGNQQKVVVAKMLAANLKVLIIDEPTKGVDIGAKASIHELISELASQGLSIIMVSSELPEILGMSDNVIVMHQGYITGMFTRAEATQENILEAAITDKNINSIKTA